MRRKRFGQNFLHDTAIINRIIDAINPSASDCIVEIGPGEGVLTAPLIESGAQVKAIEIDRDLATRLHSRFGSRLDVICADVLKTDWQSWLKTPTRLVGNLPYYITSPLLLQFCQYANQLHDVTIMVQKEVAERLVAPCGHKHYGRLTVSVALGFHVASLFNVPPSAFSPPPKVQSSVLRLLPHPQSIIVPKNFDEIVNHAFQQRRKTVQNALSHWQVEWSQTGVNPNQRAAELSVNNFIAIANHSHQQDNSLL